MELQIRNMRPEDLKPLHRLLSDPKVMEYLEPPFSEAQTKAFLENAGMCEPALIYSVETARQFIGYVIYHSYDETSVEIGWVLLPEFQGKGYATELTNALIEKAKSEQKDVVIECVPQQLATRKIAEKHGFIYCGRTDGLDVFRLPF